MKQSRYETISETYKTYKFKKIKKIFIMILSFLWNFLFEYSRSMIKISLSVLALYFLLLTLSTFSIPYTDVYKYSKVVEIIECNDTNSRINNKCYVRLLDGTTTVTKMPVKVGLDLVYIKCRGSERTIKHITHCESIDDIKTTFYNNKLRYKDYNEYVNENDKNYPKINAIHNFLTFKFL